MARNGVELSSGSQFGNVVDANGPGTKAQPNTAGSVRSQPWNYHQSGRDIGGDRGVGATKGKPGRTKSKGPAYLIAGLSLLLSFTNSTAFGAEKTSYFQSAVDELQNFQCDKSVQWCARALIASAKLPPEKRNIFRARVFMVMGQAFRFDENDFAAIHAFGTANLLKPDDPDIQSCLADALERTTQFEAAAPLIKKLVLNPHPSRFQLIALALHLSRQGAEIESSQVLEKAIAESAEPNAELLLLKGRSLTRRGLTDEAMVDFAKAGAACKFAYMGNIYKAIGCSLANKKQSRDYLLAAGQILPGDPLWHNYLADNYGMELPKSALQEHINALQSRRLCTRAYKQAALFLSKNKRETDALKCLDRIAHFRPYVADIYTTRATVLEELGNLKGAMEAANRAVSMNPYAADAWILLAHLQQRNDPVADTLATFERTTRKKQAEALLSQALQVLPANHELWKEIAAVEMSEHNTDDAIKSYENMLALTAPILPHANIVVKNEVADAHAALGTIAYQKKDKAKALAEAKLFNQYKFCPTLPPLLRAMNIRPGRMEPGKTQVEQTYIDHVMLGAMLLQTRDLDDSIVEYQAAAKANPNDIDVHSYLLDVYTEKNDWVHSAQEDFILSNKIVTNVPNQVKRMMGK